MGTVHAQRLAEGPEQWRHGRQVVREAIGQRGGGAEAGQVDGDDVPLHGEDGDHRVPGLAMVANAVEQQQRLPGTRPLVRDGHGPRSAG